MNFFIKSALVIDPQSPLHGKKTSLLIENGIIKETGAGIKPGKASVIEGKNLVACPGFVDSLANFRDPGHEYKENLESGVKAALRGGFTAVCLSPNTLPPVSNKAAVNYIVKAGKKSPLYLYPLGSVTENLEGKELAEMFDMHSSGALAFTDEMKPLQNSGVLIRALLYAKSFGGLVMVFCHDPFIARDGKVHESSATLQLGLKGIPALAEEIMVAQALFLAEYCKAPIHLLSISTKRSVQLIREAKKKKIKVTASVNAHHLYYTDADLKNFETEYKVMPPLRGKDDVKALTEGLKDGTLDILQTAHLPEDTETKVIEFDHAAFGMASLETFLPMALESLGKTTASLTRLVQSASINPRKILGIPPASIRKNQPAEITLFDPGVSWVHEAKQKKSLGVNDPLLGKKLIGKITGVFCKGSYHPNT
jgi:dihydroorotase